MAVKWFSYFRNCNTILRHYQTMRLAHLLMERMTDVAAVKLLQLREELFVNSASSSLAADLRRIANHFDPPPPDKVGSEYVAQKLGCTTTWIAELVRREEIPKSCIVPGTGNGKPWKFFRDRIDKWIESR
jgi:hypothetical protein